VKSIEFPWVMPLAGALHPDYKIVARAPLVVLIYRHNSLFGGVGRQNPFHNSIVDQQCVGVTPRDKGGTDTLVAGTGTLDRTGRSRRDTGN